MWNPETNIKGPPGPAGPPGPNGADSTVPGPPGETGATGGQIMYIGDGPPSSPVHGQTWWESDTGNSFVYYNDGNTSQWVPSHVGALPEGAAADDVIGGIITIGPTAPASPNVNDVWIDTT